MKIKQLNIELIPRIKKAEIYARRSVLSKMLEGSWSTTYKGRGIEFAGYRSYQYGDDASLIDWRASLRTKETLVREFEEYKTFSVFILLDVSDSMLFTSTEKLKAEYAAEMTYALADAILRAGDAVGLGMFNDQLITRIYPDIGSGVMEKIRKELLNKENYGGGFDMKKVLLQTRSFLKSNAVLIIISDFIGLKPGWERYMIGMGEHFEILTIMIRDPRDLRIPKGAGQYSIEDPYTKEYLYIDTDQYAEQYEKETEQEIKHFRNVIEGAKGGFVLINTKKDYLDALMRFFRKREFVTATV